MEEILNSLIQIDENCKSELNLIHQKEENIEFLVDNELSRRKTEIKTKFKFKIDMKKSEYDIKLNEFKNKLQEENKMQIEEIKNEYITQKGEIIKKIVNSIIS